jgi:hypothetical protein
LFLFSFLQGHIEDKEDGDDEYYDIADILNGYHDDEEEDGTGEVNSSEKDSMVTVNVLVEVYFVMLKDIWER